MERPSGVASTFQPASSTRNKHASAPSAALGERPAAGCSWIGSGPQCPHAQRPADRGGRDDCVRRLRRRGATSGTRVACGPTAARVDLWDWTCRSDAASGDQSGIHRRGARASAPHARTARCAPGGWNAYLCISIGALGGKNLQPARRLRLSSEAEMRRPWLAWLWDVEGEASHGDCVRTAPRRGEI